MEVSETKHKKWTEYLGTPNGVGCDSFARVSVLMSFIVFSNSCLERHFLHELPALLFATVGEVLCAMGTEYPHQHQRYFTSKTCTFSIPDAASAAHYTGKNTNRRQTP